MFAIGLCGLARSGKDTVADYLVEECGFKKFVQSEIAAQELKKQGKPDTKMNRSRKVEEMKKRLGADILVRMNFEKAKKAGIEKAVFSGMWSLAEAEFLRSNCEKFVLVAVKAEKEKRFARRTGLDAQSKKGFFKRDEHDLKVFESGQVIDTADYTIENNSTINDLKKTINELMEKI